MADNQQQRYIPPQRRGVAQDIYDSFDTTHKRHDRQKQRSRYAENSNLKKSLGAREERMEQRRISRSEISYRATLDLRPSLNATRLPLHHTPPATSQNPLHADITAELEQLEIQPSQRPQPAIPNPNYIPLEPVRHGDQVLPRYYTAHQPASGVLEMGCSLYDSLAKLVGNYSTIIAIKNAVMQRSLWLYNNESHPLHEEYTDRAISFRSNTCKELFTALECPDLVDWSEDFLWVIVSALGISLRVYGGITNSGEATDLLVSVGPTDRPCHALLCQPVKGVMQTKYSALMPDATGKELLGYLLDIRYRLQDSDKSNGGTYHGLQLKRVSWAISESNGKAQLYCYNEHRPESREEHLACGSNSPHRIDSFQMIVSDPHQIKETVKIIKAAADRAPGHKLVKVSRDCDIGILLPYTSGDAEFAKLPRDKVIGKTRAEIDELVGKGDVENLISVLTITVDRLIVHFLLLHMIEHANEHTVPGLQLFAEEVVFNQNLNTWWWNPQQDVVALDNTFAHIWQGTPRAKYHHTPWNSHKSIEVVPTFKITSEFFNGTRPAHLNFPRVPYTCQLHQEGSLSEKGFACPCLTGNHDISAMLSEACRQQGRNLMEFPWFEARPGVKFERMVERLLKHDRRFEILKSMKQCVPIGQEQEFYQSLGQPDMALDDDQLMYTTGDALAPGIVLSIFLSNDAEKISTLLEAWARAPDSADTSLCKSAVEREARCVGHIDSLPLFNDHPHLLDTKTDACTKSPIDFTTGGEVFVPEALTSWEHDWQVDMLRQLQEQHGSSGVVLQKPIYEPLGDYQLALLEEQKALLRRSCTDTSQIHFPATCASKLKPNSNGMIVRSNMTTTEALVQYLLTITKKRLPSSFGLRSGTSTGLPDTIGRVVGQDLPGMRNIFDALDGDFDPSKHELQDPVYMQLPTLWVEDQDLDNVPRLLGQVLSKVSTSRSPRTYKKNKAALIALHQSQVDQEERQNEEEGLPSFVDPTDVLDPEGRAYRRRMESAPEHQRQPLLHVPEVFEDGSWQSKATRMLAVAKSLPEELINTGKETRAAY
ncbi:hypothetical protein HII31_10511 [Pseudocercospora fuligena]|uniref:Uncharacterized protein n=1 Tax=Pseudocercospora fuligena TaxID=685502 RepID=A0A8H6RDU7_9PEZI|nr:hypothetical protein HII31_10511 [Pseudocercospora fuligena]